VLAVPELGQAAVLSALARISGRHPLLVVTPTGADAERILLEAGAFLGDGSVEIYPAWETLPFERVSPSAETMARRARLRHLLQSASSDGGRDAAGASAGQVVPAMVVLPVRSLLQTLSPWDSSLEPIAIRPGDVIDMAGLLEHLVSVGYRREYQVEHRGEVAVRGSIIDVFSPLASEPVRIDCFGDEVERLARFSPDDQRSLGDLESAVLYPARELVATGEVREVAARLLSGTGWQGGPWERFAEGEIFDGMESFLAWLDDQGDLLTDLLGPGDRVSA